MRWLALLLGAVLCACSLASEPQETARSAVSEPSDVATLQPPPVTITTSVSPAWEARSPMLVARSEMPAAVVGGLVYVPGGFNGKSGLSGTERTMESYDPRADIWTFAAEMPGSRHHLMAASIEGRLYVFGGYDQGGMPTDSAWVYEPQTRAWDLLPPMPHPVAAGTAVASGGSVYVMGGVPEGTSVLRFEPSGGTWERERPMSEAREHVTAVSADGMIYVVGGRWHDVGERASVEVFTVATGQWSAVPDMRAARGGHAAAAYRGLVLAIGGEVLASGNALADVEAFDPSLQQWTPWPPLPVGLHGLPAVVVGDHVLVLGGSTVGAAIVNDGTTYRWAP